MNSARPTDPISRPRAVLTWRQVARLLVVCAMIVLGNGCSTLNPSRSIESPSVASVSEESCSMASSFDSTMVESEAFDSSSVEEELWSVDEVLEYGLNHHPILCVRKYEVQSARARLVTAGLLPNPQFVLDTQSPVHEDGPTELRTRVTFEIPLGHKPLHRQRVAEAAICRARAAMSRQTEQILLEATDAVIEVAYRQELLELETRSNELVSKRATLEHRTFDPQTAELQLSDEVEADVDAARAENRTRRAATQLTLARMRLARSIGLRRPVLLQIIERIETDMDPLLPLEEVVSMAHHQRAELIEARSALAESQHRHALARAEAIPNPEIGPRYSDVLGEADDEIGVRFRIDVPIFDRNQGGIHETAAQVRVRRAMLDVAEMDVIHEVSSLYIELESLRSNRILSESRATELTDRYETLLSDPKIKRSLRESELLKVMQELMKLRIDQLEHRYRFARVLARLELILGQKITLKTRAS